jgi:glycosyltransferase involved in cell wall biosynthesis
MSYHVRILAGRLDRRAGSHVYNRELIRRLAGRGHRVSVVCVESIPEVADCAQVWEIPIHDYSSSRVVWRLSSLFQAIDCTRALLRADLPPADVVVGAEHLFLWGHRRTNPKTPWIYLPHSMVIDQEIEGMKYPPSMAWVTGQIYRRLQIWALNHADRTLRFTRAACEALERRYGDAIHPRFVVNPHGIELPESVRRAEVGDPIRLLWVGQLIPRKRIALAIEALSRLRDYRWRFDILGDGAERPKLKQLVGRYALGERVHFHDFQADPTPWYRQADLLLFPSCSENFPVTMLEAMSHGVPCLGMRADEIRYHNANAEIIGDQVDGFLAESDEDFRLQLERLLARPGLLPPAGAAARRKMADHYDWERHIDRCEEVFDALVSSPRAVSFSAGPVR